MEYIKGKIIDFRKVLLILLVVSSFVNIVSAQTTYVPSQHTVVSKPIGMPKGATDARSQFYDAVHFVYRDYVSTTEVLSYLNTANFRSGKFTIYVNSGGTLNTSTGVITGGYLVEYWFKDGVADYNLIPKVIVNIDTAGITTRINAKANKTTTITINGVTQDLSANRSFTVASAGRDTFSSNFKLNGVPNGLELWNDGDSVPAKGLTAKELLLLGSQRAVHPHYDIPISQVFSTPTTSVYYEIGTVFDGAGGNHQSQIVLSSAFNQNQGGNLTGTVYKQDGTVCSSTISTLTLTSDVTFTVEKAYNTGVCINNNLGVLDCIVGSGNAPNPAPVAGGTAISGGITYYRSWKRYWGRSTTTTPSNSEILAVAGGSTDINTNHNFPDGTINNIAASGSNHVFIATLASYGHITTLSVGGFDSFAAFTETTVNITNAVGHVDSYYILTSNNAFNLDTGKIIGN